MRSIFLKRFFFLKINSTSKLIQKFTYYSQWEQKKKEIPSHVVACNLFYLNLYP